MFFFQSDSHQVLNALESRELIAHDAFALQLLNVVSTSCSTDSQKYCRFLALSILMANKPEDDDEVEVDEVLLYSDPKDQGSRDPIGHMHA